LSTEDLEMYSRAFSIVRRHTMKDNSRGQTFSFVNTSLD
jgi:hypothetical protein